MFWRVRFCLIFWIFWWKNWIKWNIRRSCKMWIGRRGRYLSIECVFLWIFLVWIFYENYWILFFFSWRMDWGIFWVWRVRRFLDCLIWIRWRVIFFCEWKVNRKVKGRERFLIWRKNMIYLNNNLFNLLNKNW